MQGGLARKQNMRFNTLRDEADSIPLPSTYALVSRSTRGDLVLSDQAPTERRLYRVPNAGGTPAEFASALRRRGFAVRTSPDCSVSGEKDRVRVFVDFLSRPPAPGADRASSCPTPSWRTIFASVDLTYE
jgi:hypothetical protein